FHDSDKRDSHSPNAPMLGGPLQSSSPAFQSWTRNARSQFTESRVARAAPLYSKRLSSRRDIHSWWATSRIPAGENRGMTDQPKRLDVFFADHNQVFHGAEDWQIYERQTVKNGKALTAQEAGHDKILLATLRVLRVNTPAGLVVLLLLICASPT